MAAAHFPWCARTVRATPQESLDTYTRIRLNVGWCVGSWSDDEELQGAHDTDSYSSIAEGPRTWRIRFKIEYDNIDPFISLLISSEDLHHLA